MNSIFLDTNVLLDVLCDRQPYYEKSIEVWTLAETGAVQGFISAISFNNIYYIVRKARDRKTAEKVLGMLRDVFTPVALDGQIINQALAAGFKDFEDAIQYHSALHAKASCLISRDAADFPRSGLLILSPAEYLATLPSE